MRAMPSSISAVGDVGGQPLELDVLEIGERDRRHDLQRHGVGEIALAVDQLLDRALFRRQRHLRIGGELEAVLGDDLVVGVAHRRLDHLGHGRAAIDALEVRDRHLAGAEAVDADAVLELVKALVDFGIELGGRHHHLEFALEAFGQSFGDLHELYFADWTTILFQEPSAWCGRRDSNPHDFRHGNLNPARLPIPPRPQRAVKTRVSARRSGQALRGKRALRKARAS